MQENQALRTVTAADEAADWNFPAPDIRRVLVTGASGFLCGYLIDELLRRGLRVHGFDIVENIFRHERYQFFQGDIRNEEDLRRAMEGCDTVIHTAAVVDLLHYYDKAAEERSMSINVGGCRNVVRVCKALGIERLVHTSSVNAILDGLPIEGMYTEEHPYPTKYRDLYSKTKGLSEREVLAANGTDGLLTCAIRPSGIYGPGDPLILARIAGEADDGTFVVTLGDGTALSENSYVMNVVEGLLKAAYRLVPGSPVCGEAYFINDGHYDGNMEYFRPIIEGLGCRFPTLHIPAWPLRWGAALAEISHKYLKTRRPTILVMEVKKLTVNQPASIEKAQRDLGYGPEVSYEEAMAISLPWCREYVRTREKVDRPAIGWWLAILGGLGVFAVTGHHDPTWTLWSERVLGFIPRFVYIFGFWVAVAVHIHKGLKAVKLAEQAGFHETSLKWGWQTFILGFPSMNKLLARIERLGSRAGN